MEDPIRSQAEQGSAEAQRQLGLLYEHGDGVPLDFAEAARWFPRSADQGHVLAQWQLGHLYQYGLGVPKDYAEAAEWYRLSADHGYSVAQVALGQMYEAGDGVPEDHAEAAKWYLRAAEQIHQPLCGGLETCAVTVVVRQGTMLPPTCDSSSRP